MQEVTVKGVALDRKPAFLRGGKGIWLGKNLRKLTAVTDVLRSERVDTLLKYCNF